MISQNQFSILLQANKGIIHSICNKYCDNEEDKKDLFQEIATKAWATYHLFQGESKFSTWLYKVSCCKAIDWIRRAKSRIITISVNNLLYELTDNGAEETKLINRMCYKHCLSQLDDSEVKFVLLYAEGYSYDEMEIELGVNQNNLRVRMGRIKQKLKTL